MSSEDLADLTKKPDEHDLVKRSREIGSILLSRDIEPELRAELADLADGEGVRLVIKTEKDDEDHEHLWSVPWEFSSWPSGGELRREPRLSLVRRDHPIRKWAGEDLFTSRGCSFLAVEAANGEFPHDGPQHVGKFSEPWATFSPADGRRFLQSSTGLNVARDIFHFSGHGNSHGDLITEKNTIVSRTYFEGVVHDTRLTVLSACGQEAVEPSPVKLSLLQYMAPRQAALIGMRASVGADYAKQFFDVLYAHLFDGYSLDQSLSVARAQHAPTIWMPSIPVFYLAVQGDTRLGHFRMLAGSEEGLVEVADDVGLVDRESTPEPEPKPWYPPSAPAVPVRHLAVTGDTRLPHFRDNPMIGDPASPDVHSSSEVDKGTQAMPLAIGVDDRVWWLDGDAHGVRLREAGRLSEGEIDPPPSGTPGLDRVLSADGGIVATVQGSHLELRRVRITHDGGLELGPIRLVELPPELKSTRLLSTRVALGVVLFLFADKDHGTMSWTLRAKDWLTPKRLDGEAVAAVDIPHGVTLGLSGGGVARHEPENTGFSGFAEITNIEAAVTGGASLVLVSGRSARGKKARFRLERRARGITAEEDVIPMTSNSIIVLVHGWTGRNTALVDFDVDGNRAIVLER